MSKSEYDFSGYATRNNIRCSDGRTIIQDAFADQDGKTVPLVYQHDHNDLDNVLGHAVLENRPDGVYCYGTFNDTKMGKDAKQLVQHGDITALSIYANHLTERNRNVVHGMIREVSLVLAGANPGAFIDNVAIEHSDGSFDKLEDEAVIYSGEEISLSHADDNQKKETQMNNNSDSTKNQNSDQGDGSLDNVPDDMTIQDVIDSMTKDQTDAIAYVIGLQRMKQNGQDVTDDSDDQSAAHADSDDSDTDDSGQNGGKTIGDVFDSMTDLQKKVAYYLIGMASSLTDDQIEQLSGNSSTGSDNNSNNTNSNNSNTVAHYDEGDMIMHRNAFENDNSEPALSHDDMKEFMTEAKDYGSFKDYSEKWLEHAGQSYGVENIETLFPDAKQVGDNPALYKRDTTWVDTVLNGTRHTPFARIKTSYADLTEDEARAKGFTLDRNNNKRKMDEVFKAYKRVTTPATIYKKQRLDRDDEIDITDFDVVNFLWNEMKIMLQEELGRDILIGDGRATSADDHVNTESVRPIVGDDDLYVIYSDANDANDPTAFVDRVRLAKTGYHGSGMPTLFLSPTKHGQLMVQRDKVGRRLYDTDASLASAMGVADVVEVPVMENFTTEDGKVLDAIVVNLRDYTIGTDKGGEITQFRDFDIDFNQHKYLIETRVSGALTLPKSAIVLTHSAPKA